MTHIAAISERWKFNIKMCDHIPGKSSELMNPLGN